MRDDKALKTWIPGGASAPWFIPERHLDLEITKEATAAAGSMLGSGAVIVMDEDTCMVRAAERVVRFFSHESCGQCTPCREGTTWMEMILRRIEEGEGRSVDLDLLVDVSDGISIDLAWPPKMTTICPLGPSAVSPILALRDYFRDEVDRHVVEGGCWFPGAVKSGGALKSWGATPQTPRSQPVEIGVGSGRSTQDGASEGDRE
jgi:NADH-quinone oxidoreductase subunit F